MPEFTKIRTKEVSRIINDFARNFVDSCIPVIVAGDFNDEPNSDPIKLMEKQFTDLHVISSIEKFKKDEYPKYTLICDVCKEEGSPDW